MNKVRLGFLGVVLLALLWFLIFLKPSSIWYGVSRGYVSEALEDLDEGKVSSHDFAVPFCFDLNSKEDPSRVSQCNEFYRKFPKSDFCGVQNLLKGEWDADVIHLELSDEKIKKLLDLLQGCRAVVLDIESIRGVDRHKQSVWIAGLATAIRTRLPEVKLSVAVHAKFEDQGSWDGTQSQDWEALCKISDELLIMAYDYSYPGITPPGETAPLSWVEKVLQYAVKECPSDKLRLGLAAYGYRWRDKSVITEREKQHAKTSDDRDVIVETQAKRQEKMGLARRFGIQKFFVWALGMTQ